MCMQEKGRVYNIYIACMLKNGRINKKWIKEKQGYLSEDKTGCKNCRSKVNLSKKKKKWRPLKHTLFCGFDFGTIKYFT